MGKKNSLNRRKGRIKIVLRIIFSFLLLILTFFLISFLKNKIVNMECFRIKNIDTILPLDKLHKRIIGRSIFTVDMGKIYRRISANYPGYKKIQIIKEFPNTLKINAEKRLPFVQLKSRKYYLLDREFVVLGECSEPYPTLLIIETGDYKGRLERGEMIKNRKLVKAFELVEELEKSKFIQRFKINLINVANLESLFLLVGDVKIILGEGDFKNKLLILDSLVKKKFNDNLSSISYIDLRYKKTYVGYKR